MTSTTLRRVAAVTAGAALTLTGLSVSSAEAAPIPPPAGSDPAPAAAGASWLATQLPADGLLKTVFEGVVYDDAGVTADFAIGLSSVGGQDAAVSRATTALADPDTLAGYVGDGTDESYAGALAKMSVLAQTTDLDATDFGGVDLISRLSARVTASGDDAGRIADKSAFGEYANLVGQSLAVWALDDAGDSTAASATSFLVGEQCASGAYRLFFYDTCSEPDTDTTAFAVLALSQQASDPTVKPALDKAVAWLAGTQRPDGSFGGSGPTIGSNANSTGVAGWALGTAGQNGAATKAANWLRQQQLAFAGPCAAADRGAVTLDALGLNNAASGPLDQTSSDVATRATAQALPALLWATKPADTDTKLAGPGDFVAAGTAQSVGVAGAARDQICTTVGSTSKRLVLDAAGAGKIPVTLPAVTGQVTVSTVDAGGEADSLTLTGLSPAKLTAKGPRKVALGDRFKVKVTGLVPGESLVARFRGKLVETEANTKGIAKVRFKATKLGKAKVRFRGEFAGRAGKKTVRVTR